MDHMTNKLLPGVAAMAAVDFAPKIPVQFLIVDELLTQEAFNYPLAFLMANLMNRVYGPAAARRVVYFVFYSLRAGLWWRAPLASKSVGSVLYKALSSTINFSASVPFFYRR